MLCLKNYKEQDEKYKEELEKHARAFADTLEIEKKVFKRKIVAANAKVKLLQRKVKGEIIK